MMALREDTRNPSEGKPRDIVAELRAFDEERLNAEPWTCEEIAKRAADEIERLLSEVRDLKEMYRVDPVYELGLSSLPRKVLQAILAASPDVVCRDELMKLLPTPKRDNLDRQVYLIRRALSKHGIAVQTYYGGGYSIDRCAALRLSRNEGGENE